ncbi:MAG: tail fiber domain-containing protein, partial [Candidatus Gracilibacteria bacterium]
DAYISSAATWNAKQAALTVGVDYLAPTGNGSGLTNLTSSQVGLGSVENTALSTWAGTTNITTLGTISSGTWNGAVISDSYLNTISTVGKVSNSATTATNLNTASAIVARDALGDFSAGTITANLTGNVTGSISGNAGTVTNGIYTNGSYADPAWITSLAASKIGLGSVENTALSTWVGTSNITTLGIISSGTWNGTAIDDAHVANDITASNYLPLSGGTLVGTLAVDTINERTSDAGVTIDGFKIVNDGTITTLLGTVGDYIRIGDAGATGHSLASEDDLMVSGKLEIDGLSYFDSASEWDTTSLGATTTPLISLVNTTAATVGVQQVSPSVIQRGYGWGTTAGTSQAVDFQSYVSPSQDTTVSGNLIWQTRLNDDSWTTRMFLSSSGNLTVGATTGTGTLHIANIISDSTGAISLDSGSTGAVNIGTNANAKTITMGNTTAATALAFNAGDSSTGSINFDSNSLYIDTVNNKIGVGTNSPSDNFHISESDAGTTTVLTGLRMERLTSGTAAAGLGNALDFYLEDATGNSNEAARIDVAWEDATNASEDASIRFNIMKAGVLTEAMRIDDTGKIGIGTSAPSAEIEVVEPDGITNNRAASIQVTSYGVNGETLTGGFAIRGARGTLALPTAVQTSDRYGALYFFGYGASAFKAGASIEAYSEENFTNSTMGTSLSFKTGTIGASARTEKMRISSEGLIGIGDLTPDYTLDIASAASADSSLALADGDVAHGLTTVAQTDAYLEFSPISSTDGGLQFEALSDTNAQALNIRGIIGSIDPTDTTPAIKIVGAKSDGTTGVADLAAAETVFQVANNATNLLTVSGNGRVGIGTATPGSALHVIGNSRITGNFDVGDGTNNVGLYQGNLYLTSNVDWSPAFGISRTAVTYPAAFAYYINPTTGDLNMKSGTTLGNAVFRYQATQNGNVTMYAGTNSDVLTLNDGNSCGHNPGSSSETVTCTSDERLKTNIVFAGDILPDLMKFKIKTFNMIANGEAGYGTVAQEVMQDFPDMVIIGEDGYYRVAQPDPWKLVKGIQELNLKFTDLEVNTFGSVAETLGIETDKLKTEIADVKLSMNDLTSFNEDQAGQISNINLALQGQIDGLSASVENINQTLQLLQGSSTENTNLISALQQSIDILQGNYSSISDRLAIVETGVSTLNQQITSIDGEIDTITSEQLAQKTQIETLGSLIQGSSNESIITGDTNITNAIISGTLNILGNVMFNKDTAGGARVQTGYDSVQIKFEKEYLYIPIINITLLSEIDLNYYIVKDISTKGFTIKISQTAPFDIDFNWQAFAVEGPKIHLSNGEVIDYEINVVVSSASAELVPVIETSTDAPEATPTPTPTPTEELIAPSEPAVETTEESIVPSEPIVETPAEPSSVEETSPAEVPNETPAI